MIILNKAGDKIKELIKAEEAQLKKSRFAAKKPSGDDYKKIDLQ
jgi:hypothetical protein